ncbi:YhdP family protein [Methylotuvimicrobium alcaliphilum]|uniref:Membrane protein-like protein n=1 Tax=Methylotuvimicrobium alcaliphilum (strain DSM 19304 / NCIMB 14124 / VKM B-2133 / 20Z) TaxID=1091494 RepID=G4SV45_META2|nr:YhdP family protein [Methylotuvimicrobium alcaliphilum]CCE25143.1 Membrane protein-like protein [Methylotuvimicrobium alcaliphilum 20Z]
MIHHITRATRILLFWSLIASALSLTAVRLLMSGLESYKFELEREIGMLVDAPVQIGRIMTGMRGITPMLMLKDINVLDEDGKSLSTPVNFEEIRLNISLWRVLWTREIWRASWISIIGADVSIQRKPDGSFTLGGLQAGGETDYPLWLLQGGKFELLHSRIAWQDEMRGGKPIQFERVDLVIKNDGDRHQIHLLTGLPENLGHTLRVSMELNGNFFEPGNIDGKVYFEGTGVDVAEIMAGESLSDVSIASGVGDLKLWTHWQKSQISEAVAEINLSRVALEFKAKSALVLDRLETLFRWRDDGRRLALDVARLAVEDNRRPWADTQFSLAVERDAENAFKRLALSAHRLDMMNISELAAWPGLLPAEQAERLTALKLSGNVDDFTLFVDIDSQRFAADGLFSGLGFAGFDSIPGFFGLTGYIRGNDERGMVQLATGQSQLAPNGVFRQALSFERLQGRIDWRQTLDAWIVSSKQIMLDVPAGSTISRLFLTLPKSEASPVLELQSAFSVADLGQVKNYLPVGSIDPDTFSWLDRAFISGSIPRGGLLFSGELESYPFAESQGVFEVLFDVSDMTLNYDPEWPNLTKVDAQVLFYGPSLKVDIKKAETANCSIRQAEITIPMLNDEPNLLVSGVAEGSIINALDFLQQTPIGSSVGALRAAITPTGNTSVKLDLDIPLVGPKPIKVDGEATFDHASLVVHSFDLPVGNIKGTLKFNEQGLFADNMQAVALGSPIRVNIENESKQTTIKVVGQSAVEDLQNQFKLPWWGLVEGNTDYRLELVLPGDDNRATQLTVNSDLRGLSLALPDGLAKSKDQSRSLSLVFDLSDERLLPVRLNYDNQLNAAFKIEIAEQALHSGHFLFGAGVVDYPDDPIIKLEANRDQMNLEEWLSFIDRGGVAKEKPMPVHEIKVKTRQLINKFMDLGRLDLMLTRSGKVWVGKIDSSAAKGDLRIPVDRSGEDSIRMTMEFIDLTAMSRIKLEGGTDNLMENVPLFNIDSEKVIWRSSDIGRLVLRTVRIPKGLHFQRLTVSDRNETMNLTGRWINQGLGSTTELKGTFDGRQFGRLLNELGLYESMKETRIAAKLDLNWNGAPYQFSLERLRGKVDIELKDGRLLSIEPGLGRVLGIIAFSQWVKRLQLDFRDVYEEGLTFNSIKGRIHFADGIASTTNLEVDAVPAKITLSGNANLNDKTLDQQVRVVPKSSDAVPIAGTIVGRLAGLIAKAVTKDYQEGFFFGSQYRIIGSWEEPQVIPLREGDGLFNKTWQGLTDFPWTENND